MTAIICAMCNKPAWKKSDGSYHRYCTSGSCNNPIRRCQNCNNEFIATSNQKKYCSDICQATRARRGRQPFEKLCSWCNKPSMTPNVNTGKWPYICATCIDPLKYVVVRLKDHNVPHEWAKILISKPGCMICNLNLLVLYLPPGGSKKRARLAVDHDHECCPGQHSCGKCVRGFLCDQCNTGVGMFRDSPAFLHNAAEYIKRYHQRRGMMQ